MEEDTLRIEKSETAEGRSHVYHLLANLYLKEITPEVLTLLEDKELIDVLVGLGLELNQLLPDTNQEKLLNELSEEYAALFIVSGGILPYESARLKGLLCQEPTSEVEDFYRRCGLIVREDCHVLPDHLGMELEFMSYLARKESEAWKKGDERAASRWFRHQREFFTNHITMWVFDFLVDLMSCTLHPFYREIGRLTQRFLETEKEYLESDNFARGDEKGG